MTIEMPKSGIDVVGDTVSWVSTLISSMRGERKREHPVDEETLFSSLESSSSLERLNQLCCRRGH